MKRGRGLEGKYKVDRVSGCHLFTGALNAKGYGVVSYRGRTLYAHRLAWELEHGAIPEGDTIAHRCGTRHCVNVAHLVLREEPESEPQSNL